MANPQIENGHVDIANDIVEALARIRLSGEEMQCLWVIIRKTYGWHKKEDKISLSQFANMTGIKRQNVLRALNKLSSKKIIAIIKNDDSYITGYRLNKDFDKWIPLSKKITLSSKKITPVINIDNRVSSIMIHTKETLTKETIQKKETLSNPKIKTFLDFYFQEFKTQFQTPPIIHGGKDGKIIQRLLKSIPLQDLQNLLLIFFSSKDKFIKNSGYTLGVFQSQIQKLQINPKQSGLKAWAQEIIEEEQNGRERQKGISNSNSDVSRSI